MAGMIWLASSMISDSSFSTLAYGTVLFGLNVVFVSKTREEYDFSERDMHKENTKRCHRSHQSAACQDEIDPKGNQREGYAVGGKNM